MRSSTGHFGCWMSPARKIRWLKLRWRVTKPWNLNRQACSAQRGQSSTRHARLPGAEGLQRYWAKAYCGCGWTGRTSRVAAGVRQVVEYGRKGECRSGRGARSAPSNGYSRSHLLKATLCIATANPSWERALSGAPKLGVPLIRGSGWREDRSLDLEPHNPKYHRTE